MADTGEIFGIESSQREVICVAVADLIVAAGGFKRAAHMLGRSDKVLYKWASPNDPAQPPLLAMVALELHVVNNLDQGPAFATHYLDSLGYRISRKDKADIPNDEKRAALEAITHSAQFMALVSAALEDDQITRAEAKALLPTLAEQIASLNSLHDCLSRVAEGR